MEAYKELFRHKRNEEKRQEMIECFQKIWTNANIFGRLVNSGIKWNVTPHANFLPQELGAWTIPPIRIHRLSLSPDSEVDFAARPDFANLVHDFVDGIGANWQPQADDDPNPQDNVSAEGAQRPGNPATPTTSNSGRSGNYGGSNHSATRNTRNPPPLDTPTPTATSYRKPGNQLSDRKQTQESGEKKVSFRPQKTAPNYKRRPPVGCTGD
jgi:hypothetical protein